MKSETLVAILFGVAGLALTYYLFKQSPSATSSAGIVGGQASQAGSSVGDGAGSIVSPGNGYSGTPNHTTSASSA